MSFPAEPVMSARARLRRRVAIELSVLALATITFLLLFPHRSGGVDLTLALVALVLIAANLPATRRLWCHLPAAGTTGIWPASRVVLPVTAAALVILLAIGAVVALRGDGGSLSQRVTNPGILVAWALYFAWGLVQQTLFQFYLLGRLRILFPEQASLAAVLLAGTAYSLVHLPELAVTAAAVPVGIFWSWAYDRYRSLVPLALSHALLGGGFYYWVLGRDLAARWLEV